MVEPEMAFYDLTDNMDLAEGSSSGSSATRSTTAPRTWSSSTSTIDKTTIATLEKIVASEFLPPAVHRGGRDPRKVAARSSSSRSRGASTCKPSTSAT